MSAEKKKRAADVALASFDCVGAHAARICAGERGGGLCAPLGYAPRLLARVVCVGAKFESAFLLEFSVTIKHTFCAYYHRRSLSNFCLATHRQSPIIAAGRRRLPPQRRQISNRIGGRLVSPPDKTKRDADKKTTLRLEDADKRGRIARHRRSGWRRRWRQRAGRAAALDEQAGALHSTGGSWRRVERRVVGARASVTRSTWVRSGLLTVAATCYALERRLCCVKSAARGWRRRRRHPRASNTFCIVRFLGDARSHWRRVPSNSTISQRRKRHAERALNAAKCYTLRLQSGERERARGQTTLKRRRRRFQNAWGTYRPTAYFGMRTRRPGSPVFGMLWYSRRDQSMITDLRYWCSQGVAAAARRQRAPLK